MATPPPTTFRHCWTFRPALADTDQTQGKMNFHSKSCARGHWRPAEDARLKELVSQLGPQNWNLIAENLHGRSGKSCRLRWFNQLDPRINRKAFTEEEEERLVTAHSAYGNKWALISRLFPGRTDNAVKNHWHVMTARKRRQDSSVWRKRKHSPVSRDSGTSRNDSCESTVSESVGLTLTELSLSTSARYGGALVPKIEKVTQTGMEHMRQPKAREDGRSKSINGGCNARVGKTEVDDDVILPFYDFMGVGAS